MWSYVPIYIYIYIYLCSVCSICICIFLNYYFDILTKAFKYIIHSFSCDVSQSPFEILIKILLIFPRQNKLKRNINKTLRGVLHTPSQNKKHISSRQIHVLKEIRRYSLSKTE